MNEENTSKKFLQSYIYTEYGKFFVSTCYRKSSAMLDPEGWYYETFAWKLNNKNKREDWVADNSGAISPEQAIRQHVEVVNQLIEKGKFEEKEE